MKARNLFLGILVLASAGALAKDRVAVEGRLEAAVRAVRVAEGTGRAVGALAHLRASLLLSAEPLERDVALRELENAVRESNAFSLSTFTASLVDFPSADLLALRKLAREDRVIPLAILVRLPSGVGLPLARGPAERLVRFAASEAPGAVGVGPALVQWHAARDLESRYRSWSRMLSGFVAGGFASEADAAWASLVLEDEATLAAILKDRPLRNLYRDTFFAVANAAAGAPEGPAARAVASVARFFDGARSGRFALELGKDPRLEGALYALISQRASADLTEAALALAASLPRETWRTAVLAVLRGSEPTEHRSNVLRFALERNLAAVPRGGPETFEREGRPEVDAELFLALDAAAFTDLRGGRDVRDRLASDHRVLQALAEHRSASEAERRLAAHAKYFLRPSAVAAQLPEIVQAWRAASGTSLAAVFDEGLAGVIENRAWRDALLDATGPSGDAVREWYARRAMRGELSAEAALRLADDERFDAVTRATARANAARAFAARARAPGQDKTALLALLVDGRLAEADRVHVAARLRAGHPTDPAVELALRRAFIRGLLPDRWERREPAVLGDWNRRRLGSRDPEIRAEAAASLVALAREPETLARLLELYGSDPDPRVPAAMRAAFRTLLAADRFFRSSLIDELAIAELPAPELDALALLFLDLEPDDAFLRRLVGEVVGRPTALPETAARATCAARLAHS